MKWNVLFYPPGYEGRAGMVAIVPKDGATMDFQAFYQHVASSLPEYARPKFLRMVPEFEMTGTFKPKKTELVKRGFAPDDKRDVYIIDPVRKSFVLLTQEHIKSILTGQSRL